MHCTVLFGLRCQLLRTETRWQNPWPDWYLQLSKIYQWEEFLFWFRATTDELQQTWPWGSSNLVWRTMKWYVQGMGLFWATVVHRGLSSQRIVLTNIPLSDNETLTKHAICKPFPVHFKSFKGLKFQIFYWGVGGIPPDSPTSKC